MDIDTIIKSGLNYFHNFSNLNSLIKLFIILIIYLVFVRYAKNKLTLIIKFLGETLIKGNYLKSFFENKKMVSIAFYLIPLFVINYFVFFLGESNESNSKSDNLINNLTYVGNYLFAGYWLSNFLNHTVTYLNKFDKYKDKPLVSFSQIIFITFSIVALATIYAHFTNQSPKTLFTTLSVMSVAVFFTLKDVILGIVATILIMTNDIVKIGDWIKSEKYNADGKVVEISLITVKVLNFNKTISSIPTYSLISEGFQNQQEIINTGKRIVQRSIRIDASSVKYLTLDQIEKYKSIDYLKDYIDKRIEQMDYGLNKENKNITQDPFNPNENNLLNGLHFTNLGLFRKYIEKLVENNPMVFNEKNKKTKENGESIVIRIIEGTKEGVGLEFYCFSKKTDWDEYNYLISTLSEQIYASAKYFDIIINN